MSLLSIAFAFAWHHRVATVCTSIGIALATALVLLVLHIRRDVEEHIPPDVRQQIADEVLSPVERVLYAYGAALAVVAAGSVLATLYLTTMVRRRDHAILRSLGARPREIFTIVLFEALIQSVLGCGLGMILSRLALWILRGTLGLEYGLTTALFDFQPAEAGALAAVLALGALAALYPAWRAYRTDVAGNLRRG